MATITLHNVDDGLLIALQDEAKAKGTTVEAVAVDRLAAWQDAFNEHEERSRQLIRRLNSGENLDGPIADELRRARAESGVWLSNADVNAALSEGSR